MARGRVRLAYIQNDSNRRTTYRKRKGGLVKKLEEVTTLCAIEACCIMYSIFDSQPLVWPSVEEAHRLITKFRSSSMVDQVKRKVNQETFMRQMLQKMEEKLKKLQGENRRKEITQIMYQATMNLQATLSRLDMGDFEDLSRVTKQKVIEIDRMIEIRMRQESSSNPPPPLPPHGGGQQLVLSHHDESMLPNQYGRFPSSRPSFTIPMMTFPPPPPPIMTFPPPPSMGFPSTNMEFSLRPPQGGSGGTGAGGQQHVFGNEFEFMPPNLDQSWNPAFFMPNMMFPPMHPNMEFSLPPPQGGAGGTGNIEGGSQQLSLSNEFESMSPTHNRVQSLSPGFAMPPNMAFPPPPMPFNSLPGMDFSSVNMQDVPPPNEVANMDPNIEMPYPSNQPMFPYNHNPNMAPHEDP